MKPKLTNIFKTAYTCKMYYI